MTVAQLIANLKLAKPTDEVVIMRVTRAANHWYEIEDIEVQPSGRADTCIALIAGKSAE